ncbi:MAG: putative DNA binding domain-containing protein [Bacteroidales bacterium]|nr:putative DNA binding domain-containing protein [Bacteroidales bacterium]
MTEKEILELRDLAEVGKVQFKERIVDKYDIACEMCAMSNSHGGRIVIGINDKTGEINALSYKETQEATVALGQIASDMLHPSILIDIETVKIKGGNLVFAIISEGKNKPYHDNKGIIWKKQGSDKRRVFENVELAEMMTESGSFHPDEAAVSDASIEDLDENTIKLFLLGRFSKAFSKEDIDKDNLTDYALSWMVSKIMRNGTAESLLRNLKLIRPDGKITVAAMILFGKYTQRFLHTYTTKCISFFGNSVGGTEYRDRVRDELMEGNILHQFNTIMSFYTRNLRNVQVESNFNSLGEIEIPYPSLIEFTVNALVHRSLNLKAPVRVFLFDDRLEIHSPGTLPNGLTVEDLVSGVSFPRNELLFNNAIHLLPYAGAGSGVTRALETGIEVSFKSNEGTMEFVVTIPRKEHHVNALSSQETHQPQGQNAPSSQETHQPQGRNAPSLKKKHQLTKKHQDIINFCSIPRSAQEIMDRLGIQNQSRSRKRYIQAMIEDGLLEMTIPENPNDPNQKYRRVKK